MLLSLEVITFSQVSFDRFNHKLHHLPTFYQLHMFVFCFQFIQALLQHIKFIKTLNNICVSPHYVKTIAKRGTESIYY